MSFTPPGGGGSLSELTDVTLVGTARGDTLVRGAVDWGNLGLGANGEVLQSDGTDAGWAAIAGTGDVTAGANLGDNLLIRGDGAGKGIQNTGISIDDTDNITGVASLTVTTLTDGTLSITGGDLTAVGSIGTTGARITKLWATDVEVTNAIAGSITGNAGTVTTITGLAPDTATTQATQASITTCANLTTIGTVTTGGLGTGAVLAGVTMTLGADADGDVYYRASNVLTRLAKGTAAQVLTMNAGATAPEWAAAGGGGVSDLQGAYDGGASITVAAATPMILTGGTNSLEITSVATTETAMKITASSLTSGNGLWAYSNSASSGGNLIFIENDNASGDKTCLNIQQDADAAGLFMISGLTSTVTSSLVNIRQSSISTTSGITLLVDHDVSNSALASKTGEFVKFNSERDYSGTGTLSDDYDLLWLLRESSVNNAAATRTSAGSVLKLTNICIDTSSTTFTDSALSLEIDHTTCLATDTYAVSITHDNDGAGAAGGIDLSTMSVDEPNFKFVSDTITGAGTISEQIAIDVGGTTYYLYAYTTGS